MLVKSNTNCLRINLNKLAKRVLKSAAHTDCTTDCKIKIRELFAGNVAGRINRSSRFVYNCVNNICIIFAYYTTDNCLNFLAAGSVTNCHNLNIIFIDCIINHFVRTVRICYLEELKVAKIFSCFIKGGTFCTGTNTRVNSKNAASLNRLGHKKIL